MNLTLALLLLVQSGDQTINVIGRKPEELREEARDFVRRVGVTNRPVARFIEPVCIKALNVPRPVGERVEARIRAVAESIGAPLARGSCKANLTVTFTNVSATLIETVANRSPGIFEDGGPGQVARLKNSTAPIRWWHTVAQRTKDGSRAIGNDVPPAAFGRMDQPGGIPMGGQVFQQYRSSFSTPQMVRALTSTSIVVDVDLATGLPLDSVADLAALVGLAEVRFDEEAPANSLLSLSTSSGPRELTSLDQTFLRTLYKLPLDRTAIAHRGMLLKGLTEPPAEKR